MNTVPQNLWNPFRDWNASLEATLYFLTRSHKTSETLLGIETNLVKSQSHGIASPQNLWNPFRDWNWVKGDFTFILNVIKATKPLKPF